MSRQIINYPIFALLVFLAGFSTIVRSDQVAIVNASATMDKDSIKRILLAKSENSRLFFLSDSKKANQFTQKYSGKSASTIKRKWQKLVFSGRAKAPLKVDSIEEMINKVANNKQAIGHIDDDKIPSGQQGFRIVSD